MCTATYLTCNNSAKTPATFGAAAEVPPCVCTQALTPLSVVVCNCLSFKGMVRECHTHNRISAAR